MAGAASPLSAGGKGGETVKGRAKACMENGAFDT